MLKSSKRQTKKTRSASRNPRALLSSPLRATHSPLMAFCPIGKFVFSHADALRQKKILQDKLRQWRVNFVGLDNVIEDGLVRDYAHVEPVLEHFRRHDVDCLFIPHCNFGTEHAAALIARDIGVPVLLWGPRDAAPEPDGARLRDTLCGMFATSGVLRKLNVQFSYIENCRPDDPRLAAGVDRFLRAVNVARVLRKGARVGLIGQRIDFFWSTIVSEKDLLERFRIETLPIDMADFIAHARGRARAGRAAYEKESAEIRKTCQVEGFDDNEPLMNVLAVRDQMLALADDNGLDALAVQDFTSLVDAMQAYCFYADGMAAEILPVGIESDVHGAVTNLLLHRAGLGEQPTWLVDLTVRHPENDNAVLLWHAGAPPSMMAPGERIRLGRHWILPSPLAGMPHFPLKQGAITVARFENDGEIYKLAVGEGHSVNGPYTLNNYVWMEVDDWPEWERKLMMGPFIHHVGMIYGHYGSILEEACRYVPDLDSVRLNYSWQPLDAAQSAQRSGL